MGAFLFTLNYEAHEKSYSAISTGNLPDHLG